MLKKKQNNGLNAWTLNVECRKILAIAAFHP